MDSQTCTIAVEPIYVLYPKNGQIDATTWAIVEYSTDQKIDRPDGKKSKKFLATGYGLPTCERQYEIIGAWKKHERYGWQFDVSNWNDIVPITRDGILAYLSQSKISGIGKVLAERIYDKFGEKTLEVMDNDMDQLLEVKGISERKLVKIQQSYLKNRGARDLIAFLAPYGVPLNRILRVYKVYKGNSIEKIKQNPYCLCNLSGISFQLADRLAQNMGFNLNSDERVEAALNYALTQAEMEGHLCLPCRELLQRTVENVLHFEPTPENVQTVRDCANRLYTDEKITVYRRCCYRNKTAGVEDAVAELAFDLVHPKTGKELKEYNFDAVLAEEESKLKMQLDPEQKQAIISALSGYLTIITGGPGTGKTSIQRAILDIYQKNHKDAKIVCCAPTGKAARRMAEATGRETSTIHKAIHLDAGVEAADDYKVEPLDADLVLVDEVSMLDIYIAKYLFSAVKPGTQLVLIGDVDQLPSVGPGAVLAELINSGEIPVSRLEKVHRQDNGSSIAYNASLIRNGVLDLGYDDSFQFVESKNFAESAEICMKLYLEEVKKSGLDDVAMLSPFRKKTETGVNALNTSLQDALNPPAANKPAVQVSKERIFRLGDRVMQTKNSAEVSNGDTGYIKKIEEPEDRDDDYTVVVAFTGGRVVEYTSDNIGELDLNYATTVHKSQGSEFGTVIINVQSAHYVMLRRPLIYTAITRAKKKVILVGEKKALETAIQRKDAEQRYTWLGYKLSHDI